MGHKGVKNARKRVLLFIYEPVLLSHTGAKFSENVLRELIVQIKYEYIKLFSLINEYR